MLDYIYWWAYRFNVTKEPAVLVLGNIFWDLSDVVKIVIDCPLIYNTTGINQVTLNRSEWETWVAFELCPVIEIYRSALQTPTFTGLKWKQITP